MHTNLLCSRESRDRWPFVSWNPGAPTLEPCAARPTRPARHTISLLRAPRRASFPQVSTAHTICETWGNKWTDLAALTNLHKLAKAIKKLPLSVCASLCRSTRNGTRRALINQVVQPTCQQDHSQYIKVPYIGEAIITPC